MSGGLKWFIGIVIVIIVALTTMLLLVRTHDGPMEILSGGPFKTGELVVDVDDWSFLSELKTIELQTMLPLRSRVMWLVVFEGRMFVISNYMNTFIGKAWKRWPRRLDKDNRAIVRADGKLYELQLIRIHEGDFVEPVVREFNDKYQMNFSPDIVSNGSSWLFELTPR